MYVMTPESIKSNCSYLPIYVCICVYVHSSCVYRREEMLDDLNKDLKYDAVSLGFLKMLVGDSQGFQGFKNVREKFDQLVLFDRNEVCVRIHASVCGVVCVNACVNE
jgi:hypothetical protein